jgi:hypothetical protein
MGHACASAASIAARIHAALAHAAGGESLYGPVRVCGGYLSLRLIHESSRVETMTDIASAGLRERGKRRRTERILDAGLELLREDPSRTSQLSGSRSGRRWRR